jgi:hypothetical protein
VGCGCCATHTQSAEIKSFEEIIKNYIMILYYMSNKVLLSNFDIMDICKYLQLDLIAVVNKDKLKDHKSSCYQLHTDTQQLASVFSLSCVSL